MFLKAGQHEIMLLCFIVGTLLLTVGLNSKVGGRSIATVSLWPRADFTCNQMKFTYFHLQ